MAPGNTATNGAFHRCPRRRPAGSRCRASRNTGECHLPRRGAREPPHRHRAGSAARTLDFLTREVIVAEHFRPTTLASEVRGVALASRTSFGYPAQRLDRDTVRLCLGTGAFD